MTSVSTYYWPLIALGSTLGLTGWMLYWLGMPVIGGIVGAGTGASLGYIASGLVHTPWAVPFMVGLGLVLGLLAGAGLMRLFQHYVFFMAGASLGGAAIWSILQTFGVDRAPALQSPVMQAAVVVVGALVGGLVLMKLQRYIVAVVTSAMGAALVGAGCPQEYQFPATVIALVISLAVQIGLVSRFISQEAFERHTRRALREDQPDYGRDDE